MILEPGVTISRYRIIDEIGCGGMGHVFVAEDAELGRRIALKTLPADMAADPGRLNRFKQEARAVAAVNHPNIVVIHSVEEAEDSHFITMELIDGRPLSDLIAAGASDLPGFFGIAIPLADAVGTAHDQGVTHRDLKPANIMLTRKNRVKVLDFGLAKISRKASAPDSKTPSTRSLLSEARIVGTPDYMSPEQARGTAVDHRTDIFSIGVVLYELITGERPFRGETTAELIAAILRDNPKPAAAVNPDCPSRLSHAIDRCLAKDPELRYQSLIDLRNDLEDIRKSVVTVDSTPSKSIAVLPFRDMSPKQDQEYFCEGVTEEIINALTRIDGLRVASRMSSFQFRPESGDSRNIGRRLGVKTILEGSVRKSGDRLRITAQLIDTENGYHLWSDKFDREMQDVFAVQDEIAQSIVKALSITLGPEEEKPLVDVCTNDPRAYDFYLRGRNFFRRWGKRNVDIARRMFERAIEIDSGFALAHAGLADTYSYLYMYINSSRENLDQSVASSAKSLELDPDLAEGHAASGLALSLSRSFDDAESEFVIAIGLDPNLFEAYYFYARNSVVQGKYDEAVHYYRKASEASPDDYQVPILLAQIFHSLGRREDAEEANRKGLKLAEKAVAMNPEDARAYYMGAGALIRVGEEERGMNWAGRALAIDPDDPAILYNVACSYALTGLIDEAVDCLERTVRAGASYREWMENDSDLDPLRGHPRFQALIEVLE